MMATVTTSLWFCETGHVLINRKTVKLWSINTMKYYPETRTEELWIHPITWMNLKNTALSERKKP